MNKSTKGALAAGAATVLLVGGAGTLAYWTDTAEVSGGTFTSGHLAIAAESGTGCTGWTLDAGEGGTAVAYTPGMPLVPGDVLSQSCQFTLDVAGEHMRGTVTASPATTATGALATFLEVSPTAFTINGQPAGDGVFTEANDGAVLAVDLSVTFRPGTSAPESMDVTAALESIAVTAQQVHA